MSEITTPEGANSQLGQCLKAARQARGLTLKQVAERTGMALSTLSKVENGLMSLTYDKLLQLTSGLKMEIAELFNPAVATPAQGRPVTARRSISRAGQGQVITTKFYTYTYQCTDLIGKRMVPIVAEVRARSLEEFGPLLRHAGEEYFVVTSGRVAAFRSPVRVASRRPSLPKICLRSFLPERRSLLDRPMTTSRARARGTSGHAIQA